jgi:glycosyltransferase involved in cell wall biosynthesis
MPRTLVAIPALNESTTLAAVVAEVRDALPLADVLVVDDGSTDATAEVGRTAGAHVVVLPFNVGVGGAMRTAFRYARMHGYDRVVQVDADGQHVAEHLPDLLTALGGPDGADVVIGGRFSAGYPVHGPRRWAILLLARSLSRVCGTPLTDTTSGFRAADARAIALFADHYRAEYLGDTVESLVLAARAGLVIREVPVTMRARQGGSASHSPLRATLHLGRALLALYVSLAGGRPRLPGTQAESSAAHGSRSEADFTPWSGGDDPLAGIPLERPHAMRSARFGPLASIHAQGPR